MVFGRAELSYNALILPLHIPVKVSHHSGQTEPPDKERIFKI